MDCIDCPALSFLFSLPFSFFLSFFHLDILDGQRGKQKLAQVAPGLGRPGLSGIGPSRTQPVVVVVVVLLCCCCVVVCCVLCVVAPTTNITASSRGGPHRLSQCDDLLIVSTYPTKFGTDS